MAFESDGNLDAALSGASGWIDVDIDHVRTGFEFFVESSTSADRAQGFSIFAVHGPIVWTTASKGDYRQLLGTLYLLRSALTAKPGTYWDDEVFYKSADALKALDQAIHEARILLDNPDYRFSVEPIKPGQDQSAHHPAGDHLPLNGAFHRLFLGIGSAIRTKRHLWTLARLLLLLLLVFLFLRKAVQAAML